MKTGDTISYSLDKNGKYVGVGNTSVKVGDSIRFNIDEYSILSPTLTVEDFEPENLPYSLDENGKYVGIKTKQEGNIIFNIPDLTLTQMRYSPDGGETMTPSEYGELRGDPFNSADNSCLFLPDGSAINCQDSAPYYSDNYGVYYDTATTAIIPTWVYKISYSPTADKFVMLVYIDGTRKNIKTDKYMLSYTNVSGIPYEINQRDVNYGGGNVFYGLRSSSDADPAVATRYATTYRSTDNADNFTACDTVTYPATAGVGFYYVRNGITLSQTKGYVLVTTYGDFYAYIPAYGIYDYAYTVKNNRISYDYGATWNDYTFPFQSEYAKSPNLFFFGEQGIVAWYTGKFQISDDFGATWIEKSTSLTMSIGSLNGDDINNLYLKDNSGNFYRSTDQLTTTELLQTGVHAFSVLNEYNTNSLEWW